jgi:hypothetical protein
LRASELAAELMRLVNTAGDKHVFIRIFDRSEVRERIATPMMFRSVKNQDIVCLYMEAQVFVNRPIYAPGEEPRGLEQKKRLK